MLEMNWDLMDDDYRAELQAHLAAALEGLRSAVINQDVALARKAKAEIRRLQAELRVAA